jgi:nitrogen fixation NifU-like protein
MKRRDIYRKSDSWMDLYRKDTQEEVEQELPHGPILFYNELVADHSTHPRNVGEIAGADGFAHIGDPSCGDWMQLWIKVDSGRITDIKFQSSGCAGAIATSSMTTVLALGKTVDEAKRISDDDVVVALRGVPGRDGNCSLSGIAALREAIRNYEAAKENLTGDS